MSDISGPSTILNPHQALHELVTREEYLKPEHAIALISDVLARIHELSEEDITLLQGKVIEWREEIVFYARSSMTPRIKTTVAKCLYIVWSNSEAIDFFLDAVSHGDGWTVLDITNFLLNGWLIDQAREFFPKAWDIWYNTSIKMEPIQDTQKVFITQASAFAFQLDLDELGFKMARIVEPSITTDNPRILIYRQVVRNPEEFDMAYLEAVSYFRWEPGYVSQNLMSSLRKYTQQQFEYLESYDRIEWSMLSHLLNKQKSSQKEWVENDYNFEELDGKNYMRLMFSTLLALLFQDANHAKYFLDLLEKDDDLTCVAPVLADIVQDVWYWDINEDDVDLMPVTDCIKDGLFTPILKMYAGIEYQEIQMQVYRILKHMYGVKIRDWISTSHLTALAAQSWLTQNIPYLDIIRFVSYEISPIGCMHIQMAVLNSVSAQVLEQYRANSYNELALYVMWHYLYSRQYPSIAPDTILGIQQSQSDNICMKYLKGIYGSQPITYRVAQV